MHLIRKGTLLGAGVLAVAALMLLVFNIGGGASTVQATDPNPTVPVNDGNLSGTYDLLVHDGTKAAGAYHCISKLSHNAGTNAINSAIYCYADIDLGDTGGEPQGDGPGEGNDALPGPPPPPPYASFPPFLGTGTYVPGTDTATITVCFAIDGTPGPNIIATVTVVGMKAQLAAPPLEKVTGSATIWLNQSDAACSNLVAVGTPLASGLPTNLYRVANKAGTVPNGCTASWRTTCTLNFDGDNCTDEAELLRAKGCGRDPYNPHDGFTGAAQNLTGTYSTLAEVTEEACTAPGKVQCAAAAQTPGASYHCISTLNDAGGAFGRTIPVRIYCYIDIPGVAVNQPGYPGCSGDGFDGAAPPGIITNNPGNPGNCTGTKVFGDVDNKHSTLTATLVDAKTLETTGCFLDNDSSGALGTVYVEATQDPATGIGSVDIYIAQAANCAGSPTGAPSVASLTATRQSNNLTYDSDSDGCADHRELAGAAPTGGLRDPYNRYDFYDPSPNNGDGDLNHQDGDGAIDLVNDIFGVAFKFGTSGPTKNGVGFPNPPNPTSTQYDYTHDRGGGISGSNTWNLKAGDGTIDLVNDIFGVAFQFGHNCQ